MSHLDNLPKRDGNRRIEEKSKTAFKTAISNCQEFIVQSSDRQDYGTDYLIEASGADTMTNVIANVQLKGTGGKPNADGSVSISVKRKNLNYLAMHHGSIFVCYHIPSKRLLVRQVDDVIREYEHKNDNWINQKNLTIRFQVEFDQKFQRQFRNHLIACATGARDYRLSFATCPPENLLRSLQKGEVDIPVPNHQKQAEDLLKNLYEKGQDLTISRSFEKFHAIIGHDEDKFLYAHMAEINLGVNGKKYSRERIVESIEAIERAGGRCSFLPESLLYCVGNGWLALGEYEKAREAYHSVLVSLEGAKSAGVIAQCCKNLGSVMEKLGKPDEAYNFYVQALEFDPYLPEAHFSLALWYNRTNTYLDRALEHLDKIVWPDGSAGTLSSLQGWRAEIFFKHKKTNEAFRDIRALMSERTEPEWVRLWCARLVAIYGRTTTDSTRQAIQFWDLFLRRYGNDSRARGERLLCISMIRNNGNPGECSYDIFKQEVADIVSDGVSNPAFLWDRAGHWAQDEKNWSEAENCYRKAFELSPDEYGYCFGTALNFLNRYAEALPILMEQAERHQPDAMSWFQVAVAQEGVGDISSCIESYKKVLKLDKNYALAWFNLGGIYWNSQNEEKAKETWRETIRRFPNHELSSKLLMVFPIL